jgi:hypothetical protein
MKSKQTEISIPIKSVTLLIQPKEGKGAGKSTYLYSDMEFKNTVQNEKPEIKIHLLEGSGTSS